MIHPRRQQVRRFLWIVGFLFSALTASCAGNVKHPAVRRVEQERFLRIHEELNRKLDSLRVLSEEEDFVPAEAFPPLLHETLAAADTLIRRSYYRYQVQQILETGYRVLFNHWASRYNSAVRRSNALQDRRSDICGAIRRRDYSGALASYARLESDVRRLEKHLREINGPPAWVELDRMSSAAARLPNPTEAPFVNLSGAKEDVANVWKKSQELQSTMGDIVETALDSMRFCTRTEMQGEYNELVRVLNAGATKDGAGFHGEAMNIFADVSRRAVDLGSHLSSDSVRALGLMDEEGFDLAERILKLAETARRNLRTAEYNYATDLYESFASQLRRGNGDPSLMAKEIEYLLSLPGVEGEIEDRLSGLRERILRSLGK